MKLLQSLSGKVVVLVCAIFVVSFSPKLANIVSGDDNCVCAYDGYGYYLYLPHFFEKGNLDIKKEWTQKLQDEYCGGIYAYQIERTPEGKEINVYHLGQAFVELPAYLIGDLGARFFGYKTDGFSKPYHLLFVLNALLFIFLGLLYLRKLLLLFLSDKIVAIAVLFLYLASNIYVTFSLQYDLQHLYLFALNAIFLYHTLLFTRTQSRKHLILSALILGLTVAIRPTQVLLGIFPTILLLGTFGLRWAFFKRIWIYPLFGLLWNIPQIAYWWIIGGEPFIPNLHSEDIILSDPNIIDFLFSYKKGWLLYSPMFLIGIHGLIVLYKINKALFWSTSLFLLMYIWVMSSWECWWYAQSYGSRVMTDIYPLLAILIGLSVVNWKHRIVKIAGYTFMIACALLTILQTHQGSKGYLSYENMTKQHYWYIFGRVHIPNFSMNHMELHRRILDPNWISRAKKLPVSDYTYHETDIYSSEKQFQVEDGSMFLLSMVALDKLPSDEGMVKVEVDVKTADSTKSAIFMSETFSEYNWYNWSPLELSLGQKQGRWVKQTHYFNLQRIRHREDKMHFYFYAPNGASIDVRSLKITGHTITRK